MAVCLAAYRERDREMYGRTWAGRAWASLLVMVGRGERVRLRVGYMGGDGQNRGSGPGTGVDFGGRRQILGPRPQK